jgi:hypothetical protein
MVSCGICYHSSLKLYDVINRGNVYIAIIPEQSIEKTHPQVSSNV